ncbi:MAG: phosphate signaling complex protein PhoU [Candidatus Poribacteria bacterium]
MQRHFDQELKELQDKLLLMGGMVENMLLKAVQSLLDRDEQLAREVIDADNEPDLLEIEIDELCNRLIVLRQPAASDLRRITTAMHINRELERMADQAVNIAERSIELLSDPPVKPYIDLPKAAQIVQKMIKDSLNAFINRDTKLAREIVSRDDQVDALRDQVFRELITYMMENPRLIHPSIEIILIFRHLERLADNATNICEEIVYMVEGKIIKHQVGE